MPVTLLLADDSITIQRVIELTFADENVRVISASDGQQAIQRIDTNPPDIVLADVGMPKVDGYGVAAHIKKNPALRHIPVLLLTGAFEPIDEARARATGCDGVLVKPFDPGSLIERVRELLNGVRSQDLWPDDLPRVETPAPFTPPPSPPVPPVQPIQADVVSSRPALGPTLVPPPAPIVRPRAIEPIELPTLEMPSVAEIRPAADFLSVTVRPSLATNGAYEELRTRAEDFAFPPSFREEAASRPLPAPADAFESELDMLDVALSRLEPTASPNELDAATASEFARDLHEIRSVQPDVPEKPPVSAADTAERSDMRQIFGDWDLPNQRSINPRPPKDFVDRTDHASAEFDREFQELGALDGLDAFGSVDVFDKPEEIAQNRVDGAGIDALAMRRPIEPIDVVPVEVVPVETRPDPVAFKPIDFAPFAAPSTENSAPPAQPVRASEPETEPEHIEPMPAFVEPMPAPVSNVRPFIAPRAESPAPVVPTPAPVTIAQPATEPAQKAAPLFVPTPAPVEPPLPAFAQPMADAIVPPVVPAPSAPTALPAASVPAAPAPPPVLTQRPTLANAFSALLAAEQAQPAAKTLASQATLSEAAIEDVVKRVLARMTDEAVQRVVLDAAERIIREEIDRLKTQPN